jgi:hypothetical protein
MQKAPERVLFCVLRRWGMQDDVDKMRAVLMHRPRHRSKYTAIRPRRTYKFSGLMSLHLCRSAYMKSSTHHS